MFTGIIEATGTVVSLTPMSGDVRLVVSASWSVEDIALGDSIAINGVCLTVVEISQQMLSFDVSNETLNKTSVGQRKVGERVNLEKALLPTTRLGGHLVSGHVDGLGILVSNKKESRSWRLVFEAPKSLVKYIAAKGSICIDGTSLTVNHVDGQQFDVNIIPHTAEQTIISDYQIGQKVNLEIDLIARYIERLLTAKPEAYLKDQGVSLSKLAEHGFVK